MLGDWRIQGLSVDSTARASCRRSSSPKASAALQSRRQPFFLQSSGGVLQHSDGMDDQLVGVTPHNISGDALSAMCCSLAICLTETRSGQGSGCRIQPEQRRLPCAVWARAFRHSKTTSRPLEMRLLSPHCGLLNRTSTNLAAQVALPCERACALATPGILLSRCRRSLTDEVSSQQRFSSLDKPSTSY